MEKPGIEPVTPGLQGIHRLIRGYCFVYGRVPWLYQYWPGGFMVLRFYVQDTYRLNLQWFWFLSVSENGETALSLIRQTFCGFSMGSNQCWAGRVYGCVCILNCLWSCSLAVPVLAGWVYGKLVVNCLELCLPLIMVQNNQC